MTFGTACKRLAVCLFLLGLGACTTGQVGEKISGESFIFSGSQSVAVMRNPTEGGLLTSKFGSRRHPITGKLAPHRGIDLAAATGTPVLAAADGKVAFKGENGSFGNLVKIQHNEDVISSYAHLDDYAPGLATGKTVKKGELIGYIGTTGRSSGPHLHYEVAVSGRQVDPLGPGGINNEKVNEIAENMNDGLDKALTGVTSWVEGVQQSFSSE